MYEWYVKNLGYFKLSLYILLLVGFILVLLVKYIQFTYLKDIDLDLDSDIDISSIDKNIIKYAWMYKILRKLGLIVLYTVGFYGISFALWLFWLLGER